MTPRCSAPTTPRRPWLGALLSAVVTAAAGCSAGSPAVGPPPPTPQQTAPSAVLMGAGDIADDDGGAAATADLIRAASPDAVFTTGDNAYPDGAPADYAAWYEPTWGAFKDRTFPVPGNHDYRTGDAAGYVGYFGAEAVTNPEDGGVYYAWDVSDGWRAYAVNTEIDTSGAQLAWLRDDLAAHPDQHYILYAHRPRYTSSTAHRPSEKLCPLWDALASTGGLAIVLAGHNHQYERFAPMDCAGRQHADGARSFVVGTGGKALYDFGAATPGSEFRNATDYGVLELVLHETSYEWQFLASGRGWDGSDHVDTGNAGEVLDKGEQSLPAPAGGAPR